VFNLGEVGISDWEDGKTNKVIALAPMFGQMIHHGISRNVKHISMIACLPVAGESFPHHRLTSLNSPTVREHLKNKVFASAGISP
jgi:hypothetical protein